jgi:predicted RNase H-like HicB family nuclease
MTEYAVVFEEAQDGSWSAYVPELPGVISAADDPDQLEAGIREAIALYREATGGAQQRASGVEVRTIAV